MTTSKQAVKPRCTQGTACGYACISSKLTCSDKILKRDADALVKAAQSKTSDYSAWQSLARGNFGEVKASADGSRVVKLSLHPDAFGKYEVDLATKMAALGHSPAIYSHSDKHIEMGLAKGKTLWAGYMPDKDQPSANAEQAKAMAAALTDLHRLGFSHGDAHSQQFMFDGDKLSLLDFGLSKPALDDPRKLLQDFNKVARLANWDNAELDSDANVQLIRKHRALYAAAGKNKAKEEQVAKQYYADLLQERTSNV